MARAALGARIDDRLVATARLEIASATAKGKRVVA
jgi:hypothetical protein